MKYFLYNILFVTLFSSNEQSNDYINNLKLYVYNCQEYLDELSKIKEDNFNKQNRLSNELKKLKKELKDIEEYIEKLTEQNLEILSLYTKGDATKFLLEEIK